MRAVVIGGSGQIGGWLLRTLRAHGHEAVGTYATAPGPGLTHLDAADLEGAAAWVAARRPDVVFYPAGFTWVDGCERDPARARAANLEQPLNLGRVALRSGGRFVYFSTDYVFDGATGGYTEESPTNPLSVYGQVKLDAEHVLRAELGERALTVRTSWVFGPERQGKNFAYQVMRTLAEGRTMVCPTDQVANPSYGPDVAGAVVSLIERGRSGLVHLVGPEAIDRASWARRIATAFGLDPGPVVGRTTAELGQGAPRPLNASLRTPRLDAWLPGAFRPLDRCLDDFRRLTSDPAEGWADPLPSH